MIWHITCHWSLSTPSKTLENLQFFDVFRGYRKRPVEWNGSESVTCLGFCWSLHLCFLRFNFTKDFKTTESSIKNKHQTRSKNVSSNTQPILYFMRDIFRALSTINMEFFAQVVNSFQPLSIFAESSILNAWEGSEYVPVSKKVFT